MIPELESDVGRFGRRVPLDHPVTYQPIELAEFEGCWSIDRRIEDRFTGRVGHLEGQALFRRNGMDLVYSETGALKFDDQPILTATREYLWRSCGSSVHVSFADGRPFHRFALSGPTAEASHWCDPDQYEVRYDFSNWPKWLATWTVQGPRKNYISKTSFMRYDALVRQLDNVGRYHASV